MEYSEPVPDPDLPGSPFSISNIVEHIGRYSRIRRNCRHSSPRNIEYFY